MHHANNTDYSARVIHGAYYPHIDGIRAFAVLPVVLFHVLANLCPGGFAGVDVFFVISGYLISGGILRDLEQDRFTIRSFYHRRIRRILPAYFAMIAGVFAIGLVIYYALPLMYMSDAVIMGTLFSSNLFFHVLQTDYFAPNAQTNPILHLWSLSVEEQFYLCIPLLCAALWKLRRRWVAPALAVLACLSFAAAVGAVAVGAQGDAFYLLQFRAWELLTGALVAMLPARPSPSPVAADLTSGSHGGSPPRRAAGGFLAPVGLLLVLIPYAVLSSETPFPGATVLPSVLGTALLIRHGQTGWVNRVLSWEPLTFTGKMSYSLYLWHWPIVVFWKYAVYDQMCLGDYLGIFVLSILMGYLSCRFVEIPVRRSAAWTMRRSFLFAAASVILLVSLGLACSLGKGWPASLHAAANRVSSIEDYQSRVGRMLSLAVKRLGSPLGKAAVKSFPSAAGSDGEFRRFKGDFRLGSAQKEPEVLLIGDSHAGVLARGFNAVLAEQEKAGLIMYRTSLDTIPDMFDTSGPECRQVLEELARRPTISKVVLASRWVGHLHADTASSAPSMYDRIGAFARCVHAMNRTLCILADVPSYDFSPPEMAARIRIITPRYMERGWADGCQEETVYKREQEAINRQLAAVCDQTGAVFIPLYLGFKQHGTYLALAVENGKLVSLYRDRDHLSSAGSVRAARFILPYVFPEEANVRATGGDLMRTRASRDP